MSQEIRMLCLWDYNTFTGFATVSKNLVQSIVKHYGNKIKIDICAINYFGEDYKESENVHVISAKKKDIAEDDFGRYVFMASLRNTDYDIIFILQDLGVIVPTIKFLKDIKKEKEIAKKKVFKSIFYFPVDFALTPNLGKDLEFFDFLATYTNYGKSHVIRINKKVEKKLHVIPHGNNMDDFYPLPSDEISAFRKEYFGRNADKFIVTNINRNQSRKDIPTTIFGFLEYWDEYNKNSFLYLHLDPKDPMGWNIRTILAQTPLREGVDFMLPPEGEMSKGASVEKINKIYNASDVYLTTATGEGWGLSITEAMATKLPILVPNHTSIGEIAKHGERGYMLNTLYPIVAMVDNVVRFQSDLYEIAENLDIIQQNIKKQEPIHLQKVENAYQYVKSISWDWISKEFIKVIRSMNN